VSLTEHLRDADSPVRVFIDEISPVLAASQGYSHEAQAMAGSLGLNRLSRAELLVPTDDGVSTSISGMAFDIRTRMQLDGYEAQSSAAAIGLFKFVGMSQDVENGHHRARILREAFEIAVTLFVSASCDDSGDRAAIVFAFCESIFRAGPAALEGSFGEACDVAESGQDFVDNISAASLDDLSNLRDVNSQQIAAWVEKIREGARFEPNPQLSGSELVNGADADWMVGDTLFECKVYEKITVSRLRGFLRQLLGYVLLDLHDELKIRSVGIWLPRQASTQVWNLRSLLGQDPEVLLPKLRQAFLKATGNEQLAVHQPVTRRRKQQLVADNVHTPVGYLASLANSTDQDIRFRVGRNSVTPEPTLLALAQDRYARVRTGVAQNTRAPLEILDMLRDDTSVVVRRAVAANIAARGIDASHDSSLSTAEHEGVMQARESSALELVSVRQDRNDWVLDPRWFREFLTGVVTGHKVPLRSLLPEATFHEYLCSSRVLDFPEGLYEAIPDEIILDLFQLDRPDDVRRLVARGLNIDDRAVRGVLLADSDPEIRWETFVKSVGYQDPEISILIEKLASSQQERVSFRRGKLPGNHRSSARASKDIDVQVLEVIARHQSTPAAVLNELIKTKAPEVLLGLAGNPVLLQATRQAVIDRMRATRSRNCREQFARSPATPAKVLEHLANSRAPEIREGVASNPATSEKVLRELADDVDLDVRGRLLCNQSAPADLVQRVLEDLLRTSSGRDLEDVLLWVNRQYERIDGEISEELVQTALDRLSKSRLRNPDVRETVATHEFVHARTLARLATSADAGLRECVAANPHTPVETLEQLADDEVAAVRRRVAANPTTARHTILKLSADNDDVVRRTLINNSNAAVNVTSTLERARPSSARRGLTIGELREMAANTRAEIRVQAARHRSSTPDILTLLSDDPRSFRPRRAVAANPNTPVHILWTLADDKDIEVRQNVALNPNTPSHLLMHLAGMSVDMALLVALNPDASPEVLNELTGDSEVLVRHVAKVTQAARAIEAGTDLLIETVKNRQKK